MSHYCEKARWAIERLGLPYHEERHLQGFHYPRTRWCSGGLHVPVLLDHGQAIKDSTVILKYLDRYGSPETRLYPDTPMERRQVEDLEELFDEVLGVESRRWVYFHSLPHAHATLQMAGQGVPAWEKLLAPLCYPFMRQFIQRRLRINESDVMAGLVRAREVVRTVDTLLADGRKYLVGNKFSAADLTLACMMAPFVLPTQYGIRLPTIDEAPQSMRETVREFRNTASGQFALRLFALKQHQVSTALKRVEASPA